MVDTAGTDKADTLRNNWSYPTSIYFGCGRISELAEVCQANGLQRPLLVTDQGLAAQGFIADMLNATQQAGLRTRVFAQVKPNPTAKNIEQGIQVFRSGNHDGVIAVGGGSALDAGKAIGLMARQTLSLWELEDSGDNWRRADPQAMCPVIAVPTTAGTGSEVGRAAVIMDEDRLCKKIIFHPKMMPTAVIADPALTCGLPPALTAATGLDAFVHLFEAWCAPGYHPIADGIALQGMRLVSQWLPQACTHGDDLVARSHMLCAASMGAMAFQKGLGAVHALAHALGALYDIHHGLANAILLPYVVQHNRPAIESRIAQVAAQVGCSQHRFEDFLHWTLEFRARLEIPSTLSAVDIDTRHSVQIGQMAQQDPSAATNPLRLSARQYSDLFIHAVTGHNGAR